MTEDDAAMLHGLLSLAEKVPWQIAETNSTAASEVSVKSTVVPSPAFVEDPAQHCIPDACIMIMT